MRRQRLVLAALLAMGAAPQDPVPPPTNGAAESARAEEQRLAASRVGAAATLRETEAKVEEAAQRVARLAARRREAVQQLEARAAELRPFLPLAERLGLFPAETLLAVPAPPGEAIRGLAVLRGITRTLERQAEGLRAQIAEADEAQRALDGGLSELREVQQRQALEAAQLDRQLDAARALRARLEDAAADQARRAAAEASHAETLRAALGAMAASRARTDQLLEQDADRAARQRRDAALETTRRRQAEIAEPAGPGVTSGAIVPVSGPIVRRWGDQTDAGPATGIALQAPPKGRVVSPCAGRVVFAQPFRSYGLLVILDCGAGFHFVLSGFGRLDTEAGDHVEPGEPLGVMPDWDPTSEARRPALSVELRRAGQPLDPIPYLRPAS